MWNVRFDNSSRKKYLDLIEHVVDCINTGKLKFGEALPTQRELSKRIGLSIGTITKAFKELERLGYITGQIGRGTFVKDFSGTFDEVIDPDNQGGVKYNFGHYKTPEYVGPAAQMALLSGIQESVSQEDFFFKLNDSFTGGTVYHREAAIEWFKLIGLKSATVDNVVITNSITHTNSLILLTFCKPGDVILVEDTCNPVLRDQILFHQMRIQGVNMDEKGIRPDHLKDMIKEFRPKLLITNPTIHNPTTITTPSKRKQEIATIVQESEMLIYEQGHMDHFHDKMPQTYFDLIPENALYASSLTNAINAAIRMGMVAASTEHIAKLNMAIRLSVWMTSHLMNETGSHLITSGKALEILNAKKAIALKRNQLIKNSFEDFEFNQYKFGFHIWLRLPRQWRAIEFVNQAFGEGMLVRNGELFKIGSAPADTHIRISLGAILSDQLFEKAIPILKKKLLSHPSVLLNLSNPY